MVSSSYNREMSLGAPDVITGRRDGRQTWLNTPGLADAGRRHQARDAGHV